MITDRVTRIVDTCRRHPWPLALATLLLAVVIAWYTAGHLGMNTDVDKLISPDLPWRQREAAFDKAFPQTTNLLVIVIDGEAADYADDAAQALTERLSARPDLFRTVRRPDGSPFFARNGALFLPVTEVQQLADQLIAAQPLLGSLAADPSLRGFLD